MRPLLLIRQEPEDEMGVAPTALEKTSLPSLLVDAWEPEARWPSLEEVSAVLAFGGSMNCDQSDRYPWLATERALIAEALRENLPVLGVCLGAQLIVRALDRPVVKAPERRIGFQEIRLTSAGREDPLLGILPGRTSFFQWHEDAFALPPGASLLATDSDGGVQAFRLGSAWGVQFHPEVTAPELDRWFESAADGDGHVWGRPASELRSEVSDDLPAAVRRGEELFVGFGRLVADNEDAIRTR